jgi:hypothetical protein
MFPAFNPFTELLHMQELAIGCQNGRDIVGNCPMKFELHQVAGFCVEQIRGNLVLMRATVEIAARLLPDDPKTPSKCDEKDDTR